MTRLLLGLLVATLVIGAAPTVVFADNAEQVEALSLKGADAYGEEKYQEAIEHFLAAYEIEPVPNLLFNIARCYEKMRDWDNAITYFEKFVVAPDVESKHRQQAQAKIKSLEEVRRAEETQRESELEEERLAKEREKQRDERRKRFKDEAPPPVVQGSPDRTLAYIIGGSGLALIGGGAVFGLLASQKQSDFDDATTPQARRDAQDSGKTLALVADSMFIAGGIATAIGVVLFATAKPETEPQVSVWADDKSAGVGFGMSF